MDADRYEVGALGERDLKQVLDIWRNVFADRADDLNMDEGVFRNRILDHPAFVSNGMSIARMHGDPVGFALAVAPESGETGFLSIFCGRSRSQAEGHRHGTCQNR
jgi:hypothetical protein